ncbi:MAG: class I SAM-dependent methyltransferase [Planctomycetota bacterium]
MDDPRLHRHVAQGVICCDPEWEAAYRRFETPEEEINKFTRRYRAFGFEQLAPDTRILEIFCGRGNGLVSLSRMGFEQIEGADLSEELLLDFLSTHPHLSADVHLADCMDLPFETNSYDAVVVQGGLHHLPTLPGDLRRTLSEVERVLRPDGRFFVIEPWRTPFLIAVHAIVERKLMRKIYAKGDALAEMTDHERVTYEQWLGQPDVILHAFAEHFEPIQVQKRWGKLAYIGKPRSG